MNGLSSGELLEIIIAWSSSFHWASSLSSLAMVSFLTMTDALNAALITNTQTQLATNGILNIINAIVAFVICFFVDKF